MIEKDGKKVYDQDDVKNMSKERLDEILSMPGVVIEGTAIVRDKDGNIKEASQ